MKKRKSDNHGFSLVELIVVIAIMAVLMTVLAPAMLRYVEKTKEQKDDSAVSEVRNALELTLADHAIFSELGGADVVVKVTGSTGVITVTAPTASPHDKILSEICATANAGSSNEINIVSKDRAKKTYAVKATFPAGSDGYKLTAGAWSGDGSAFE
jgi:prepilin-type N-terminal cleavage/methylation domain-containing protein